MSHENITVEFHKFDPKEELRRLSVAVAEKLHMQAPSDSDLRMTVRKGGEKFRAYCRIASKAGVFLAEESAASPEGTLAKIEKEIGRQLNRWKSARFAGASVIQGGAA